MTSNEEEKRCPLCAEEMDWTDQQFMPCKCGYQICVWCWHHIIDMAEKDQTEGRCPACRTIYEKEKIVAMQTNCERTMRKISSRKAKPPKTKPKNNEVKKDLTNIRVMQRKMVYVIGLPVSLADEDILVRKEYFGQYGKVTKVSLSRTAGGAIQQFANDTCSVYITYSKEEETLRCIQSVHGFVLEGRFLRASFGTAKYCHAWLKNTPCNNHDCLYLHNIGADEDSFGKDEVAAVHTRSRVQQIVGSTNNVVKRSGDMLPPSVDGICNSSSTFNDKATIRSGISDATHSSANIPLTSKEKEGSNAVAHKMTTFVDVVGRPNCSAPEKDRYFSEDRRISNLCSEFSSVTINGDNQAGEPYTFPTMFKMSCSNNHTWNRLFENNPDDPSFLSDDQGSNDSRNRAFFGHPSYPAIISEDSSGPDLLHKKTDSVNGFTVDSDPVHSHENEAPLPIRCINSVLSNSCQEMKFQKSAKSDRIYKSSNSFSNEEIVEHLRRIDGGGDVTNDKENPDLDAVEGSIISNIMSIGLDSFEDSLAMPKGLSEFLNETDDLGGSAWSSINCNQSRNLLVKQGGYANQMAGPALPEFRDNKEQYMCNPQYPVHRSQGLAPPGFSVPSRDPPPGFSSSGRTGSLSRDSSGTGLTNGSPFFNTYLPPSSTRLNSSMDDNIYFFDPSLLNCSKGSQTNGLKRPSLETRPTSNQQLSPFDWLLMQKSDQDSRFSQFQSTQKEPSYTSHMGNNGLSGLDDVYQLSSRLANGHQNYDHQSFFTQMSQQTYGNGHMPNINGYMHSMDEVQQQRNCEVGLTEHQRNERLGVDYFPGYGNSMFYSSDVYTRVFGL